MEFKSHYWDSLTDKAAFISFVKQIHNLDLTLWDEAGFWDDDFVPFTFFEAGSVISNTCLYLHDAVIQGKRARMLQISTVGTHPDFRRQGLNRDLTQKALVWAEGNYTGLFLFADEDAIPYYLKCDFKPLKEYLHRVTARPRMKRMGIRQLNPGLDKDLLLIYAYAQSRAPVSDIFALMSPRLFMFHALYTLRSNIYEIPDLQCLVLMKRENGTLHIYDIVGNVMPAFHNVYPYIADEDDSSIVFHVPTDKLQLAGVESEELVNSHAFSLGEFPLKLPVIQYTAKA